uniref:Very-long-chain (3R)-3-hydroxyacyl-CoA dehydratase n=1 Tax=Anisakis simplex TaxID=6269 RepID=A0A0M3K3X2_ANISI
LILWKTLLGLISGMSYSKIYESVELELQIFQTAAILEIVHAAIGIVRSPVGTTAIQVFSRVTVVWMVLYKVVSARDSIGVPMLLLAWSITEVVRYSYYALSLINSVPRLLVWMRYTFFIILYPMGASGEVFTMFAALPEVALRKHFTIEMPNAANVTFSFWWYLIGLILFYVPGFPQMYFYMFGQRKKVLTRDAEKKLE